MNRLKIAVVGAGLLGSRHARVFAEQLEAPLAAVVDVSIERAQAVASKHGGRAFTSLADALNSVEFDGVAVATPDHLHRSPVLEALAARKHVFMEKPLATTLDDANAIVAATDATDRVTMVNFSQRLLPDYAWMQRAIAAGDIGSPRMVTSVKFDTIHVPTKMLSWAAQSSPFYFMSSHDLDLTCWYLGLAPRRVFATQTRGWLDGQGIATPDGVNVLIEFDDGVGANFHSSWIHPNTYPVVADGWMQIVGTHGAMGYNNRKRVVEFHNARGGQEIAFSGPATANEVDGKLEGAFTESVRAFLRCVETGAEPDTSPRRVMPTTLIQDAAARSLQSNSPIAISSG